MTDTYTVDRLRLDAAELAARLEAPLVELVPSRGRPGNIAELLEAWASSRAITPHPPPAELVVIVDADDPTLDGYLELELPPWAELLVGPRLRLGGTLNEVAPLFAGGRTAVGFMGDDHRPRSTAWDRELVEAHWRRPFAVIYGNDLVRGADLPTAVSIDARIVDALGYFVPPGMVHLYLDDYWRRLGEDLGTLTYLDDVVIEHCHPTAGTAAMDDRYREVNAPDVYAADEARFLAYLDELHPAALRTLAPIIRAELERLTRVATARSAADPATGGDIHSMYDPQATERPPGAPESREPAAEAPTHQGGPS